MSKPVSRKIEVLTFADVKKAARTLYYSFDDDDVHRYVSRHLEHDPEYRKKCDMLFYECYVHAHLIHGLVVAIKGEDHEQRDTFETVAVWTHPESEDFNNYLTLIRSGFARLAWMSGSEGRRRVFEDLFKVLHDNGADIIKRDPNHQNIWTLVYLGSTPHARGKGNVRAIFEHMFENYIDPANASAYLESSSLVNIPIYEKFGFRAVADIWLGDKNNKDDNARMDVMLRALSDEKVYAWINELVYASNKEQALLELGKKRELYDDLALVLWHSFGVMTSLLEEIVTVYPLLSPPNLNIPSSNRVCNALALLQCVASHPDTRTPFLNAQIPLFLYPFLNTNSKQRPFEYLRLTSLGVIGALVKNDTPEVIQFLLTTEIIPLCLKIMESSTELSKTVAIFIVQKILIDDAGLSYICQTFDRFEAVSNVLKLMIDQLAANPTGRLLKHVIRCYLRLADNHDARIALKDRLPEALKDNTFADILRDDAATKSCLTQLLTNIQQ
ncbi:hypothetical protein CANARDRAFT_197886 [[Candida] arabinofermentans NRRL YB-2248]|uniref:Cell differentiation protein rcd1 n=1 Tax=[Candida] arabinofermentans NRRL YB-2248 TaxID=983967 RepID=A0A1E4T1V8_9ASCO|nr:hypothetical protein CANARDRAFT_197886 [[Candida] arabinofermentans NRRL YB-2248]